MHIPPDVKDVMEKPWDEIEPHFQELVQRPLTSESLENWLGDWSHWSSLMYEVYQRLYVAITTDTNNVEIQKQYDVFVDETLPEQRAVEQSLKEKLLASSLSVNGFEIPLRNLRAQAALFRESNLPLLSEELKLSREYDRIIGEQTVNWDGAQVTVPQLQTAYLEIDRSRRERAWRLAAGRQLADRQILNKLWTDLLKLRVSIAANAGLPDYRAYMWQQRLRFDYTPDDCKSFNQAIQQVVVPAARRIYEKRLRSLRVDSLRPWDLDVDIAGRAPLVPYHTIEDLISKTAVIFQRVDPELGSQFEIMRREELLDLDNRAGKAPGGYCTEFPAAKRPFIFANSVGIHDDVQTLLHEGGHAFHVFESSRLPYFFQMEVPLEFAEVASMAMEYLASPYLHMDDAGFYTQSEAARARIEVIEHSLLFWPYMAVVDSFQHWAYENPETAAVPAACDAKWSDLWMQYMEGQDWNGLDDEMMTGWQRKAHIFEDPFYYVEYGLAQLGAVQVWKNSLDDPVSAVAAYRRALALGGTAPLPELFKTAGARLAFDVEALIEAVSLMESTIESLEKLV